MKVQVEIMYVQTHFSDFRILLLNQSNFLFLTVHSCGNGILEVFCTCALSLGYSNINVEYSVLLLSWKVMLG